MSIWGVFITQDPFYLRTDQAYAYSGDNPVNSWDPSGNCGWNPISDLSQAWNDTGSKVVDRVASQVKSLVTRGESYTKSEISHIGRLARLYSCSALTDTLTGMRIDQSLDGWSVVQSMLADYVVADISLSGLVSTEVESIYSRYGQVYVYGAVGAAIPGASVGLRVGYMTTWSNLVNLWAFNKPVATQSQVNSFLQGSSTSIGGYAPLAGISILGVIGPSGALVTNLNGYSLEIGVGVGIGEQIYGYQSTELFKMSDSISW